MNYDCMWCGEPCGPHDPLHEMWSPNMVLSVEGPRIGAVHADCSIRSLVGSIGHQMGVCYCVRPDDPFDDPPGLTKREAAREAARYFREHPVI